MSNFDFNTAEEQRATGSLIPDNTVVMVVAKLRPGGHGQDGWLKTNKDGTCLMVDLEFTVDGGDFDRRKFWSMMVTEGDTDGQQKAANISRSKLRAMLESAHGVNPSDNSPEAQAKRKVASYSDFDGLRFCAKVGIEAGGLKDKMAGPDSERYADKNTLKAVITPDEAAYVSPGAQTPASGPAMAAAVAGIAKQTAAAKPAWAN